jgi:hypothetical protein
MKHNGFNAIEYDDWAIWTPLPGSGMTHPIRDWAAAHHPAGAWVSGRTSGMIFAPGSH